MDNDMIMLELTEKMDKAVEEGTEIPKEFIDGMAAIKKAGAPVPELPRNLETDPLPFGNLKYVGEVFKTYILLESEDELVFVDWKNSAEEKAEWAKKLSVDVFLEDTVENIDKLKENCKVICLRAGYNDGVYAKKTDTESQIENHTVTYANDFYDVYSLLGANADSMDESCTDVEQWKAHYRSFPFDEKELTKYRKHYRRMWNTVGRLMKSGLHLEITGQENIPEEDGVIFVCNHRRSLDIPLAYLALGGKHARFLCKKEYELSKLQATVQAIGTIFVNRSSKASSKTARRTMIQTLLHGGNVLIFPEGTRNKTEQILLPFRYGAVRIAGKTGAKIIPMVIEKLGKKSYRIAIGESIKVGVGDALEETNQELWEYMRGMLEGM